MFKNYKNINKKAFTLVELAIVLMVIGILAGVVLRNMGGFTTQARDSRRVADLRNVGIYLQAYYSRFGYYPTSSSASDTSWEALTRNLKEANIVDSLPNDPGGRSYQYFACLKRLEDSPTRPNVAVLRAVLDTNSNNNPEIFENALATATYATCTPSDINPGTNFNNNCSTTLGYYCISF